MTEQPTKNFSMMITEINVNGFRLLNLCQKVKTPGLWEAAVTNDAGIEAYGSGYMPLLALKNCLTDMHRRIEENAAPVDDNFDDLV